MTAAHPDATPVDPTGAAAPRCPVRKLDPDGSTGGPALERVSGPTGDRWVVRTFALARQVLRAQDATQQAGFGAEEIARGGKMRQPILYLEGPQHREQRSAAARLFAPKVTEDYREMIEALSDELTARLRADRWVDLTRLSLTLATQVAGRVIGLTNSSPRGMERRLESFFDFGAGDGRRTVRSLLRTLRSRSAVLRFFALDVKPAIRARRRHPGEDVVSQLLAQGFSDFEILTECITYGAAGMATTREFITVAAWHLLDDADLLRRYRAADTAERVQVLEEILRLEPVVGHLYRRTTAPLTLTTTEGDQLVGVDERVDLDIRAINADAATVGAEPLGLCPARELPRSVPPTVMSFGDGNHRCPGAPLAILESEIFLSRLLRTDLVAAGPPRVAYNAVTQGYDLDAFLLRPA